MPTLTKKELRKMDRIILLAKTPPEDRSEVAAKFDHAIELEELKTLTPTQSDIERIREELFRADVAYKLAGLDRTGNVAERYLRGGLVSQYNSMKIGRAIATTARPSDERCLETWRLEIDGRKQYLKSRYGLE